MTKTETMPTVSIQVPREQWEAVEDAAWRERVSRAEWVRQAIADKLKRQRRAK
jgi:metal-responsive CopG/Arc/MetJ family transcriptional regulator